MIGYKNLRKIISVIVIVAFVFSFQGDTFLISQEIDEIVSQFNKSKEAYIKSNYVEAKNRLERLIGIIREGSLDRPDILGQCYLLLGAIYEKEEKNILAEENYRRAKEEYGIESIDGVVLSDLAIYKRVIKGETELDKWFQKALNEYKDGDYDNSENRLRRIIDIITKRGLDRNDILGKCYLLIGVIYEEIDFLEEATENYQKAIRYGIQSIEGVYLEGLSIYKKVVEGRAEQELERSKMEKEKRIIEEERGRMVIEKESKREKKKKFPWLLVVGVVAVGAILVILLTKKKKPEPSPNPEFVTNVDSINVPEGGTATFNVRLSAQPSSNVSVSVARVSGDSDIDVQSGSTMTFTTSNWNQSQTVTLAANEDSDITDGTAVIRISSSGIVNKDITATEIDNDSSRNLAPNPSFENGNGDTPAGWVPSGEGAEYDWNNDVKHTGSYSVSIGSLSNAWTSYSWITEDFITVESGVEYELSVWALYDQEPSENETAEISIRQYNSQNDMVASSGAVVGYSGSSWTNRAFFIRMDENTAKIKILLEHIYRNSQSAIVYFDDVSFKKR